MQNIFFKNLGYLSPRNQLFLMNNKIKNDVPTKIYRFNFEPQGRYILCQRQCLYLNADTDNYVIANSEIILLLLLMSFQLTNNVKHII